MPELVYAGVDVGNTTTEVVLAMRGTGGLHVLGARRALTRDMKGSAASIRRAARLLEGVEADVGRRASRVLLSELQPVRTGLTELPVQSTRSPIVRLNAPGASTPAGAGYVQGRHVPFTELHAAQTENTDVVLSVPSEVDFEDAAREIMRAIERGVRVVAVLAANDDAVLIANRLQRAMPIVDEVNTRAIPKHETIAVEVAPREDGACLKVLSDVLALSSVFALTPEEGRRSLDLVRELADAHAAALMREHGAQEVSGEAEEDGWIEFKEGGDLTRLPLSCGAGVLASRVLPGSVRRLSLPEAVSPQQEEWGKLISVESDRTAYSDLYAVDLPSLGRALFASGSKSNFRASPIALLRSERNYGDAAELLRQISGREVVVTSSESRAAYLGAMTTPAAPRDATVCDLGGGTVDLVSETDAVTAAGAGELVTVSVQTVLGISHALAERVKRWPSVFVAGPHLAHREDGQRVFVNEPAPSDAIGRLCTHVNGEYGPFAEGLSPEEWRAMRLAIKSQVIAANVRRSLLALGCTPSTLVLCGGVAQDSEVARIIADRLSLEGTVVANANVCGQYGTRYAVAVGLILSYFGSVSG